LIAADRRNQQIACTGSGNVGDPDRLVLLALLLLAGGFKELDGRRTAERLKPEPACRLGVSRAALQVGSARITT
jgi:hypothetical protein